MSIYGNPVMMGGGGGGGGDPRPLWILNPDVMDTIASVSPYISNLNSSSTGNPNYAATLAFSPFVDKINNLSATNSRYHWLPQKGTYGGNSGVAFFGRYGYDRSGLIFATKVKANTYSSLKVRVEVSSGAFTGPYLQLRLVPAIAFTSDVDPANPLYAQEIANGSTLADTEITVSLANITTDFYVSFFDYSGFTKLRSIYVN